MSEAETVARLSPGMEDVPPVAIRQIIAAYRNWVRALKAVHRGTGRVTAARVDEIRINLGRWWAKKQFDPSYLNDHRNRLSPEDEALLHGFFAAGELKQRFDNAHDAISKLLKQMDRLNMSDVFSDIIWTDPSALVARAHSDAGSL